jgi:hypothetical protein
VGTSLGSPLLNEVLFLPAPGDDQFVELAGPGSLAGLTLVDESDQTYALPAGLPALAADDVLLIVFDGGNNVAGNVVHASPAGFLEGASGSVELRDGAGVLDRVAWGVDEPNAVPLSTGGMWGDPEPGLTIGRAPESTEVGPSAWHPFEPDDATPGSPNAQPAVDALLPFDGAVLPPGQVTLHWYPVAGAEEYQVQVSTSDTFASTAVDDIVGEPEIQVTLSAGEYFWRVGAVGDGGSAALSAAQTLTLATDGPSVAAADVTQSVPYFSQHKDTKMLLLESDRQTGDHAWDSAHPALDVNDKADNWNCALAALAMLNRFFGGDVSQDRIGYEIFKDRRPGPELDLNWGHGVNYPGQVEQAFAFALGVTATPFPAYQRNTDEEWAFITAALDAGDPLLSTTRQHATVITGYVEEDGKKLIYMNDPWSGPYRTDLALAKFVWFWRPSGDPDPPDDEPGIETDTDGDGMVDFDEVQRFHTSPTIDDTDRDQLTDKNDVAESVFGKFGYSAFGWVDGKRDWDDDGAPNELDCDSDNDGKGDGDDPDDWGDPPTPPDPVACGPGTGSVILSWKADATFDLFLLPDHAGTIDDAWDQETLPGFEYIINWWCLAAPELTDRHYSVEDFRPGARYVGVSFWGPCGLDPHTLSFTLTVRLADGTVQQFSDTLTKGVDDWRLYGPFDLAPPP